MKNNLKIGAYIALIALYALNRDGDLSAEEVIITRDLMERMTSTDLCEYEEDVDVAKLCFGIIEEYLKEQGV